MKEIWKDICGYEGLYKISNYGEVKSIRKNIVMRPGDNGRGYKFIYLNKGGLVQRYYVHRLVALFFIPNPENKPQVNHIDCNKGNNNVDNLEWVTTTEQMQHASKNDKLYCSEFQKQQTILANSGIKSHLSKLKDDDIIKIRKLSKIDGLTNSEIGLLFGVHRETIGYIVRGKTWKHIK